MTDPELLRRAIDASGLSASRFSREVLGLADDSTVYRALTGSRALHPSARVICRAVVADPALTLAFLAARAGAT